MKRYTALKVASDHPHRYRLVGPAAEGERSDWPDKLVLRLENDDRWQAVVSIRRGLHGAYVACDTSGMELPGIQVEGENLPEWKLSA